LLNSGNAGVGVGNARFAHEGSSTCLSGCEFAMLSVNGAQLKPKHPSGACSPYGEPQSKYTDIMQQQGGGQHLQLHPHQPPVPLTYGG
jgi:hypothetical protein